MTRNFCDRLSMRYLKWSIRRKVEKCLRLHTGGELYFTELDGMIKKDKLFLFLSLNKTIKYTKYNQIVVSGEFGKCVKAGQDAGFVRKDIKLLLLNGGLRKKEEPILLEGIPMKGKALFVDDSFFSGTTCYAAKAFMKQFGCDVDEAFVFYDGSKKRFSWLHSLYRYY